MDHFYGAITPIKGAHVDYYCGAIYKYLAAFVCVLAGLNIFIIPLHIGGTYGPFTEEGGDVTIYADGSKYLADNWLPAFGVDDYVADFRHFAQAPSAGLADNGESMATLDEEKANPPTAEYPAYRLSKLQRYSSFIFGPVGQWFFLAGDTNYPVFYGLLAFYYSITVFSVFWFILPFGRAPAFMALALAVCSHGLVSVHYNVYFMQSLSLMICAITLCALPYIRLFSYAGLRTYGACFVFLCAAYLHFTAVVLPIIAAAIIRGRKTPDQKTINIGSRRAAAIPVGLFLLVIAGSVFVDFTGSVGNYIPLIKKMISETRGAKTADTEKSIWGVPLRPATGTWSRLALGAYSRQHIEWEENASVAALRTVSATGALAIAFSVTAWVLIFLWRKNARFETPYKLFWVFLVFALAAISISGHHAITQSTLYKQAKGAQNTLVLLYALMVLPYAVMHAANLRSRASRLFFRAYGVVLVSFVATMFYPRLMLATELAYGHNGAVIMEPSFYSESERIMNGNGAPLVLFEPRSLADGYFHMMPFFGESILPIRTFPLNYWRSPNKPGEPYRGVDIRESLPHDLFSGEDFGCLWLMRPHVVEERESFLAGSYTRHVWKAEKVDKMREPRLILSGRHYETEMAVPGHQENGVGLVGSYVRNGSAVLITPPGMEIRGLQIRLFAASKTAFENLSRFIAAPEYASHFEDSPHVEMNEPDIVISGVQRNDGKSRYFEIGRAEGEFFVMLTADGKVVQP